MRINLNIPDELLSKIDNEAKSMYVSRTAWIVTLISNYMQGKDSLTALNNFAKLIEAKEIKSNAENVEK